MWGNYQLTNVLSDILNERYYKLTEISSSLSANEETAGDFLLYLTLSSIASLSGPRLIILEINSPVDVRVRLLCAGAAAAMSQRGRSVRSRQIGK